MRWNISRFKRVQVEVYSKPWQISKIELFVKWVFQENKAHQIFRETNISYPLIRTRTSAYQGVRNVRFSENSACFVYLKTRFEIHPLVLLPTISILDKSWQKYLFPVLGLQAKNSCIGSTVNPSKGHKLCRIRDLIAFEISIITKLIKLCWK